MTTPTLMQDTMARTPQPGFAPAIVHDVLRSSGQPLSLSARTAFEPLFARDFSHVRVHADARAAESARAVDAAAYTVGSHIVFGTPPRNALLAHELTHVAQQSERGASLPSSLRIAERSEVAEAEADTIARHIDSATPARVQQSTGLQLSRQQATATAAGTGIRRIDASAASVSWIDPASPAGGHVTDPAPPATLTVPFVTGSSGFRFSNYLHGWCETADSVHLTNHGFETDSGIYRGPSYLGIPSHAYATSRSGAPFTDAGGIEEIGRAHV